MTDTINVPRKLLERIIGKMNIVWQKTDETEELRTLLQAPSQPAQVHGWQMVPVKATIEMVEAGYEASLGQPDRSRYACVIEQYDAMLAAAPVKREVMMPERKDDQGAPTVNLHIFREGWNACLDEFARLNGSKDQ